VKGLGAPRFWEDSGESLGSAKNNGRTRAAVHPLRGPSSRLEFLQPLLRVVSVRRRAEGQGGMSVKQMTLAWELPLALAPKMVLVALADNANDEGVCWPLLRTICRKTSLCERAVRDCIRLLEECGCLTVEKRSGRGNVYTVHPDRFREPDPGTTCRSTPAAHAGAPAPDAGVPRHHVPETPAPDAGVLEPSRESPSEPSLTPARATEAGPGSAEPEGPAFPQLRATYPGRSGRSDWLTAEHHCSLRLEEGQTWATLLAAVLRYAAFCAATGRTGTTFVLDPARFFAGREGPWSDPWTLPVAVDSPAERRARDEARRLQELVDGRAARNLADFRLPYAHESADAYSTALRNEENHRGPGCSGVAELARKKRA
jgi:hypothetical protein